MVKHITLCLSGGGFRATIFHLGVIDYLCQTHRLEMLDAVYGVSGGALIAAHLAHRWSEYSDTKLFATAAMPLLRKCSEGIIDRIVWANVLWQAKRSTSLSRMLSSLFTYPLHSQCRPTYLVCSSLNDLSQFAVEIRSKRLFQLSSKEEKGNELRNIGITTINTSDAVAMSACFPIAFEPIVLSTDSTGLDRSVLGPNHRVADGGIVDNCAIRMANAMQSPRSEGHIFLISDAGKIFDDLDPQEERTSTVISPMRTIDYLMDQNANAQLSKLSRQNERVATIKLTDARRLLDAQELPVDAGLVRATLRIRTNFDAFTFSEIVALYRFGIALSKHVWEQDLGEEAVQVDGNGLLASEHLAGSSLNAVWRDIAIKTRPSGFEEFVEFLLLKPGVALASIALILFAALLAMGAGLRALLSVN